MRALLVAMILMALVQPTRAAPALLAVWINGRDTGQVVTVLRDGAQLTLADAAYRALGLALPDAGDGPHDLAQMPGLVATVDEAEQRLLLTVRADALPRQLYDLGADPPQAVTQSGSGAILRYDTSLSADDVSRFGRSLSGGASFALDAFTPDLRVSNSGFVSASRWGWQPVRLDSVVALERPETLSHLYLGDVINVTPAWGRAVRFGGLQWARDFSLRPGLVTQPLPAFFGQSDVPATVDVFSGAARLYQQQVAPGPFELRNVPVLTGGGAATIVTRDVLGRETRQTVSLYTDPAMLAPGLDSFALEGGFLRRGYGRDSFGYGTALLSGNWRRGLTDRLTVQAHGEAAPGLVGGSGGAQWGFGFGSLSADAALSGGKTSGALVSLTAHALAGPLTLFAQTLDASKGWRDLASLDGTPTLRQRRQLGVTADLDWGGTLGASWIATRYGGQAARDYLSATWSAQLPRAAFTTLAVLKDVQGGAFSVQLSLNMPLGRRGLKNGLGGVSVANDNGRLSSLALVDNPADPDGGFGYRLAGGWQDGTRLRATGQWIGQRLALDGGVSLDGDRTALRLDAGGALVFLRGSLFASHDPGAAVALVRTGDANIRIYRENRPVAVSDSDGEALLTGLEAWAPNRIAVESRDYDFDTLLENTEMVAAPRRGAGIVLDFTPQARHPVLAQVTRGIPMATPLGARVLLDGDDTPLALGRDGMLFIAELQQPRGAVVEIGDRRCRFRIAPQAERSATARTPLLCLREASGAY